MLLPVGLPIGLSEDFLPVNNSLNLASKPFSNRFLPWAVSAMILFVALVGLVLVFQMTTSARKEAAIAEAEINALKQREHTLMDAAKAVKGSFTGDQQQALPAAHALVDRKTFSWSRLLADLEGSLPNNVRVSRIAVREVTIQSGQTVAQLDLAVFTQNAATISEMISGMHREGTFQVEVRNQNLQKGRGESGTEYELFVIYRARSSYSENVAEVDASRSTGEVSR
jgi:Tfp pilus assembly protein PilN